MQTVLLLFVCVSGKGISWNGKFGSYALLMGSGCVDDEQSEIMGFINKKCSKRVAEMSKAHDKLSKEFSKLKYDNSQLKDRISSLKKSLDDEIKM